MWVADVAAVEVDVAAAVLFRFRARAQVPRVRVDGRPWRDAQSFGDQPDRRHLAQQQQEHHSLLSSMSSFLLSQRKSRGQRVVETLLMKYASCVGSGVGTAAGVGVVVEWYCAAGVVVAAIAGVALVVEGVLKQRPRTMNSVEDRPHSYRLRS